MFSLKIEPIYGNHNYFIRLATRKTRFPCSKTSAFSLLFRLSPPSARNVKRIQVEPASRRSILASRQNSLHALRANEVGSPAKSARDSPRSPSTQIETLLFASPPSRRADLSAILSAVPVAAEVEAPQRRWTEIKISDCAATVLVEIIQALSEQQKSRQ